jgi:3-hydroxy-3-methylglutaryl CoA synthase
MSPSYILIWETRVALPDSERFDKVAAGKYTVDLGQQKMSALADFEDSVTMALNGNYILYSS